MQGRQVDSKAARRCTHNAARERLITLGARDMVARGVVVGSLCDRRLQVVAVLWPHSGWWRSCCCLLRAPCVVRTLSRGVGGGGGGERELKNGTGSSSNAVLLATVHLQRRVATICLASTGWRLASRAG